MKTQFKKKKTANQALDYNTLSKISNDTEIFHLIFCLYNEPEKKQVNSNFYFKITPDGELSITKSIMFKMKSI